MPPGVYFNGSFTVSIWVRFYSNESMNEATIFDFGNGIDSDNVKIYLINKVPFCNLYACPGAKFLIKASKELSANKWYHLALTSKGSLLTLYVDGENWAQDYLAPIIGVTRKNCYIGSSNYIDYFTPVSKYVTASFDDFIILNRALNASEVIELNKSNNLARQFGANLIAYWDFNLASTCMYILNRYFSI
jgi:hypothetical protein